MLKQSNAKTGLLKNHLANKEQHGISFWLNLKKNLNPQII